MSLTSYRAAPPRVKSEQGVASCEQNAIRYSPEKSDIKIDVKKLDAQVLFSVHDSGKGIDPKYKERIFEKFYQVPSTDTAKTGTGLGLAISKDFIEAQGGKIWMESEIGTGSTFSFSLNV